MGPDTHALVCAFATLLDQAGIGVAAMNSSGRLTMFNRTVEEMVGRRFAPVSRQELPRMYPLYDPSATRPLTVEELPIVRAWIGEPVVNAHVTLRPAQGQVRHLRANAVALPGAEGGRRGAVVLVEDLTDAPAGTATFADLRDALFENLSHEIRTPLSTILGHTELLEDQEVAASTRVGTSLAAIARAGRSLEGLAQQITVLADSARRRPPVNARVIENPADRQEPAYRSTRYTIYPSGWDQVADPRRRHWRVHVEDAGDGWAIRWRNQCLNYRYEWEFEPPRGSRTHDFLERSRFSERAAITRARQAVDRLRIHGQTFTEFVDEVQAEAAARARAALAGGASGSLTAATLPVLPLRARLRRCLSPLPPTPGLDRPPPEQ